MRTPHHFSLIEFIRHRARSDFNNITQMEKKETRRSVKRACDACRLRKVKCSGSGSSGDSSKCFQCAQSELDCIYSARSKSLAGNKATRSNIKRGRVISLYKQGTRMEVGGLLDPKLKSVTAEAIFLAQHYPYAINSQYNEQFFLDLMPYYAETVYPGSPIISPIELEKIIGEMAHDRINAALVYVIGAITIGLTLASTESVPSMMEQVRFLSSRALELRGPYRPHDNISLKYILVSFFLHMCLASLQDHDGAWFYLREAATLLQLTRINEDVINNDSKTDAVSKQMKQMYWCVYINERYRAIYDYRHPILNHPKWKYPYELLPEHIEEYTKAHIRLFEWYIDDRFMKNWLQTSKSPHLNMEWILRIKEQLDQSDPEDISDLPREEFEEMYYFDIVLTRWWLRILLWKIATSGGYLDADPSSGWLYVGYPITMAPRLRRLIEQTQLRSIEMSCGCIVRKLYEVISPLADLIITLPVESSDQLQTNIGDAKFLLKFLMKNQRTGPTRCGVFEQMLKRLENKHPSIYFNTN